MKMKRSDVRTFVVALVAVAVGTNGPAIAHGVQHAIFSHDSDKVDGIHAVESTAADKDEKLVATNAAGNLPKSIIPKANADTLDGQDSSAFAPSLHAHSGGDITSGMVDKSFIDPDIARDSEISAASYTAGSGLDLNGNVFSIDPNETQARITTACSAGQFLQSIGVTGTAVCANDQNSGGDVTSVTAGTGLTGGGLTGAVTLNANLTSPGGENGSASTVARGDHHHDGRYINASPGATESASININGTLGTTGLLETGTGTGTSQPPELKGVVIRRINSRNPAAGQLVAKAMGEDGEVHFQRDGTSGGFILNGGPEGNGNLYRAACMGMNGAGTPVNKYIGESQGITQVFTNAQSLVYFSCSFGDPLSIRHETYITLHRGADLGSDWEWVGYVISTLNQ
ncbi:MAG: hypothetical protein M3198_15095 [Actinomycetota bacterium]|nr:hypothetical protein [Actinomycetota bacterium]